MWRCFPAEIYIYLPLWSCNKQLGGDTVVRRSWGVTSISLTLSVAWELPWSWRLFARLYAALEYWSLKLLIWLKNSTWVSCLFLGSACMGTVSPLKLERVAGLSHAPSPDSQIVCPLWKQVLHHNLFTDQLQIPRFSALSRWKTGTRGRGQSLGWRLCSILAGLCWPDRPAAEQSGQERKVVKAEREKVGVSTGEKWWGQGVWVTWEGRGIPFRAATSEDSIICFQ